MRTRKFSELTKDWPAERKEIARRVRATLAPVHQTPAADGKIGEVKKRWTVIFSGKYLADPSGKTNNIAWTSDRREALRFARALGGRVVDADKLLINLKRKGK